MRIIYEYVLLEKFAFVMNSLNMLHNNTIYIYIYTCFLGHEELNVYSKFLTVLFQAIMSFLSLSLSHTM
jgi:membrane-anchored protein YejM (alkaline phosphatase superfamily)